MRMIGDSEMVFNGFQVFTEKNEHITCGEDLDYKCKAKKNKREKLKMIKNIITSRHCHSLVRRPHFHK
jgi:hypothetical protein